MLLCIFNINEDFQEYFGSECLDFIPYRRTSIYNTKQNYIFVSVASYRDDECSLTIKSLYDKAKYPEKIIIGICQQNKLKTEDCLQTLNHSLSKYKSQIRIHNMKHTEAKGPTYARYWCSKLWEGEEYFFQIDSHTQFEYDWDHNLFKMINECDSKKPVLSVYPPTREQIKLDGSPEMSNGKLVNKIPVFLAGWVKPSSTPIKSPKPFVAGGFMFLRGNFLYEVPYDPNLSHLFQGEETLFSARLFTNGWDFYTPNINICSHHYGRKDKVKYWDDHKEATECRQKAEKRILFMLNIQKNHNLAKDFLRDIHQYGFGTFRSLDDFWNASGIDFTKDGDDGIEDWGNNKQPSDKFKDWCFKYSEWKKIRKWT